MFKIILNLVSMIMLMLSHTAYTSLNSRDSIETGFVSITKISNQYDHPFKDLKYVIKWAQGLNANLNVSIDDQHLSYLKAVHDKRFKLYINDLTSFAPDVCAIDNNGKLITKTVLINQGFKIFNDHSFPINDSFDNCHIQFNCSCQSDNGKVRGGFVDTSLISERFVRHQAAISTGNFNLTIIKLPHRSIGSYVCGVNNSGDAVVGFLDWDDNSNRAFLWTHEDGMYFLPSLENGNISKAYGISHNKQIIIGHSNRVNDGAAEAVIWINRDIVYAIDDLLKYQNIQPPLYQNYILTKALKISPNGKALFGIGKSKINNTTIDWIASLP